MACAAWGGTWERQAGARPFALAKDSTIGHPQECMLIILGFVTASRNR